MKQKLTKNRFKEYFIFIYSKIMNKQLIHKFPSFIKPTYETTTNKYEKEKYDIVVAIPYGKRAFLWFTYYKDKNVCCILELDRNQKIQDNITYLDWNYDIQFALGTILSGYILDHEDETVDQKYFLIDDIFAYKGFYFGNPVPLCFNVKFNHLKKCLSEINKNNRNKNYSFHSITMFNNIDKDYTFLNDTTYNIKHIQYRCSYDILPSLNLIYKKNNDNIVTTNNEQIQNIIVPPYFLNLKACNIRNKRLFIIKADICFDVYYLLAKNNEIFQYAFIPDYNTSVMMNNLFRNIPENKSIDLIEESDDEDTFQNTKQDKYVNLKKELVMECIFNKKFRKWIPLQVKPYGYKKHVPNLHELITDKKMSYNNIHARQRK